MRFDSKARLIGLLSATTMAAIVMASLLPPTGYRAPGLAGRSSSSLPISPRRLFCVRSGLLEAVQGLTPDRLPDLTSALCGTLGAISAAMLVKLFMHARNCTIYFPGSLPAVPKPPRR